MNSLLQQTPIIRKMLLTDVDRVILIEREIFLFPWSPGNFSDSINTGYHCQILEQDNTLFGYGVMTIGADEAHILTIGIAAEWQSKGWGKALLNYFIQLAKQENAKSMILDVRVSNHGAANLYRQIGFEQIAIRKGYYPAMCEREDAIVMQLML
jgi:[ribosomal protein S18]-alanine N-acetyltransferase